MAQRRQDRTTLALEERAEKEAQDGSTASEDNKVRGGVAAAVGAVGGVPELPGVRQAMGEG